MQLLTDYFSSIKKVHDYFGYVEDWVTIPLDDATEYVWELSQNENGSGYVRFALHKCELPSDDNEEGGEYYENEIYTQRFLPKWVYRGEEYTMVCVDTRTDGNKYLRIFDNSKELKV